MKYFRIALLKTDVAGMAIQTSTIGRVGGSKKKKNNKKIKHLPLIVDRNIVKMIN